MQCTFTINIEMYAQYVFIKSFKQRCTTSMRDRERKKGNMETAVYRSKKEPAMALYLTGDTRKIFV